MKEAVEADTKWTLWQLGKQFRNHYWTNGWYRTWKTQWTVASNESKREYYGLERDLKTPEWLRDRCSRLTLPEKEFLRQFTRHTAAIKAEELAAIHVNSGDNSQLVSFG